MNAEPSTFSDPVFGRLVLIKDHVPRAAGLQMAVDQVLLETSSVPVLRTYRWESPCVTIGYFESLAAARVAFPALPVVRRWTGGGLVVHGADAPYSLIVPRSEAFTEVRPSDAYRLIHGLLARSLGQRLSGVTLAETEAPRLGSACFENPVPADLLRDGRKVGGAGQRRTRLGLLHQGSLHLGGTSFDEAGIFASFLASDVQEASLSTDTLSLARDLAVTRYDHSRWNADRDSRSNGTPAGNVIPP
jgi:lipoate-protein ligase A